MEKTFVFRVSRWRAIPFFIFGGMLLLFSAAMLGASKQIGESYNSVLAQICFALFGSLLILCSLLILLISGIRILKKPIILLLDSQGIHYYYATFHSKKKVIQIPWDKLVQIKIDDFVIYHSEEAVVMDGKLPGKTSYIMFKVKEHFLDDYGMWKNNIFLNKRSNTLSVMSSIFARFSDQQLRESVNMYGSSPTDGASNQLELKNK